MKTIYIYIAIFCCLLPLVLANPAFTPASRRGKGKPGQSNNLISHTHKPHHHHHINHTHNNRQKHYHSRTHKLISDELKYIVDQEIDELFRTNYSKQLTLYPFINLTSFAENLLSKLVQSNSAVNFAFSDQSKDVPQYDDVESDDASATNRNNSYPNKVYGEGTESKFGPIMEYVVQRIQSIFSVYKYEDLSRPVPNPESFDVVKAGETAVQASDNTGATEDERFRQNLPDGSTVATPTTTRKTRTTRARRTTSSRTTTPRTTSTTVSRTTRSKRTRLTRTTPSKGLSTKTTKVTKPTKPTKPTTTTTTSTTTTLPPPPPSTTTTTTSTTTTAAVPILKDETPSTTTSNAVTSAAAPSSTSAKSDDNVASASPSTSAPSSTSAATSSASIPTSTSAASSTAEVVRDEPSSSSTAAPSPAPPAPAPVSEESDYE